jgi:hypothetical protein
MRWFAQENDSMKFKKLAVLVLPAIALFSSMNADAAGLDPRATAYRNLVLGNENSTGNFRHGCITLAGDHVCLPLVALDGRRLADLTVLNGDVAYVSVPAHASLRLGSAKALHVGIATAVFNQVVFLEAARDGVKVSLAQAHAFAVQQLQLFRKNPTFRMPRGETAQQFFLSPRSVIAYQRGMIEGREQAKIQKMFPALKKSEAFKAWFRQRLPRHKVTINGRPPNFSLPQQLI